MKEKSKRVLYYDLLNIAACIAVIALHHNGLVHTFTGDMERMFACRSRILLGSSHFFNVKWRYVNELSQEIFYKNILFEAFI